jgi:hypothetical protein
LGPALIRADLKVKRIDRPKPLLLSRRPAGFESFVQEPGHLICF